MKQINIGRENIQIWGKEREDILIKFRKALNRWSISMPQVEPLVLDFGLKNFYEEGMIEYWMANEEKEGYCGKFLFVFDGQRCPSHHHRIKHETFFVVKGSVKMELDNKECLMKEGDIQVMPAGVNRSFIGQGNALLLEVSKPCVLKDNIFNNKSIGENGVV